MMLHEEPRMGIFDISQGWVHVVIHLQRDWMHQRLMLQFLKQDGSKCNRLEIFNHRWSLWMRIAVISVKVCWRNNVAPGTVLYLWRKQVIQSYGWMFDMVVWKQWLVNGWRWVTQWTCSRAIDWQWPVSAESRWNGCSKKQCRGYNSRQACICWSKWTLSRRDSAFGRSAGLFHYAVMMMMMMMMMMLQLFTYRSIVFSRLTEPMRGRLNLEELFFSYDAEMDCWVSLASMAWVEMTACMQLLSYASGRIVAQLVVSFNKSFSEVLARHVRSGLDEAILP